MTPCAGWDEVRFAPDGDPATFDDDENLRHLGHACAGPEAAATESQEADSPHQALAMRQRRVVLPVVAQGAVGGPMPGVSAFGIL